MKTLKYSFLIVLMAVAAVSCNDYLDVNQNPNVPQEAPAHLLLAPMYSAMARGVQRDARMIGKYTQYFLQKTAGEAWDTHG